MGAGNCLLDTGQDGAVIDLALFVAVIALPQMTHTHTENEGSSISYLNLFNCRMSISCCKYTSKII